jgi:geranylgeranyl pyrophosphate synthase
VTPPVASAPGLAEIFEPVREELARVEREFARHLESRVELIPQMGKYVQMSGGKRVRPAVLLMAARLCGYRGDRSTPPSSSSSTRPRSSTTTSSTAPRCGAAG